MKVLWINYEYPPLGGGTAIANEYLVKEFKRLPCLTMDVLTSSAGNFNQQHLSPNISLIRLDIGKNNQNLHHQSYADLLKFFWHSTRWTWKHRQNYDLIHAFSGLPGGITAWLSGKPYLISFRGAEEPGYEPRHDFFLRLIKPLLALFYRRANFLDANSLYLKNLILKSWPDLKIQVINNGVDATKFYPASKPVRQPIILCTSRLAARKGVDRLVKAMPLVLAKIPQAKLRLVGKGVLESKLKKLVRGLRLKRSVEFLGRMDHNRLAAVYRRAKIFVLPSLSESQSNSLLEALATGLPAVTTNIGGNPELINKHNGLLVTPENSEELAQAIVKLLNSQVKITQKKVFSWKKAAKRYWILYSRLSV